MCKNKLELYRAAKEYKRLTEQKAEIEARLSELKDDIIPYVQKHGISNPRSVSGSKIMHTRQFKVSCIECARTDPDKDKLKEFFGEEYSQYTKITEYTQLRVS